MLYKQNLIDWHLITANRCLKNFKIKLVIFEFQSKYQIYVAYYRRNRPFKLDLEFRVQEMKGRLLFMHFLKDLHEKQSAFRFLNSEFRVQFEKPTAFIIINIYNLFLTPFHITSARYLNISQCIGYFQVIYVFQWNCKL